MTPEQEMYRERNAIIRKCHAALPGYQCEVCGEDAVGQTSDSNETPLCDEHAQDWMRAHEAQESLRRQWWS